MSPAAKTLLALALSGATLSLVSLGIWLTVNRDISGIAFGHVVSKAPGIVAIADRENRLTDIVIGTGTVITNKRQSVPLESLAIGQFVQVTGERLNKQTIRARVIRFMLSPRGPKPHEVR